MKTIYVQIFRPLLFLVWAAEGKTGLPLGAFIIGLTCILISGIIIETSVKAGDV